MRVSFKHTTSMYEPFLIVDLDVIPRIGECLQFLSMGEGSQDLGHLTSLEVVHVTHMIERVGSSHVHAVQVMVQQFADDRHAIYVDWLYPEQRPAWMSDELVLHCDVVPRRGEIIELAHLRTDAATKSGMDIQSVAILIDRGALDCPAEEWDAAVAKWQSDMKKFDMP